MSEGGQVDGVRYPWVSFVFGLANVKMWCQVRDDGGVGPVGCVELPPRALLAAVGTRVGVGLGRDQDCRGLIWRGNLDVANRVCVCVIRLKVWLLEV